jgi:hypothetical protein
VGEALTDVIYHVSPVETPFFKIWRHERRDMAGVTGKSMRARRRRMAKPLRYSPRSGLHRKHEWVYDVLVAAS